MNTAGNREQHEAVKKLQVCPEWDQLGIQNA